MAEKEITQSEFLANKAERMNTLQELKQVIMNEVKAGSVPAKETILEVMIFDYYFIYFLESFIDFSDPKFEETLPNIHSILLPKIESGELKLMPDKIS